MILSMTGFGRGIATSPTKKIIIEIKSLNSKQLDLQARVPAYFREYEVWMRNEIASLLHRGKVDLNVQVESTSPESSLKLNIPVVEAYKSQIAEMSRALSLPEPQDWYSILLRLPETFSSETRQADQADVVALKNAMLQACSALTEFRAKEGEKLFTFFVEKINNISSLLSEIDPYEQSRVEKIRQRLEEQLSKLESIEYDKGRLEAELIFYIEKLDVTEEKTRLRSHLHYFLETLDTGEDQGKKLGFIAQEIGREVNTLGSKSNNADMQRIVVKMKDELEQIKEQVLNVL